MAAPTPGNPPELQAHLDAFYKAHTAAIAASQTGSKSQAEGAAGSIAPDLASGAMGLKK
jgi:hypothetical protein